MAKTRGRTEKSDETAKRDRDRRLRYLGALGLLADCSVYVPEEIREQIMVCFEDAAADGSLRWRRFFDRIEIEPAGEDRNPDQAKS